MYSMSSHLVNDIFMSRNQNSEKTLTCCVARRLFACLFGECVRHNHVVVVAYMFICFAITRYNYSSNNS